MLWAGIWGRHKSVVCRVQAPEPGPSRTGPALSLCWAVCDAGCTCWSRGEQGAGWPLSLRKPESPTAWEALVDLPPGFKPLPCGAGNKSSSVTRQSRSIFCTQALSQALTAPGAVGPTSKLLHQNPCVPSPFLPVTCWAIQGKSLNLSGPQPLRVRSGDSSTYVAGQGEKEMHHHV